MGARTGMALSYFRPSLNSVAQWLMWSRENTNFTYRLTPRNRGCLAHMVSCVTKKPLAEIRGYLDEPEIDVELTNYLSERIGQLWERHHNIDRTPLFGRRLGWYAMVRALKPRLVVETGVDKGIGSVLLAAALRRNAADGAAGEYVGTDINSAAGYLLAGPYAEHGRILYGDSIESLATLDKPVDLFINDSDHSVDYEAREYHAIREKLSPGAVILGDNAHASDALQVFAEETGRQFLFFKEEPENHWYPGAGIGFAF
ncbi:MAG: hypothetical protein VR70_15680 [Rhodospirillaceae bacterium BRH_c57]|nr:MAG: hypothetical protein VR70_15680 [Rhodospirillaceae bacterium BRH_c57]